MSGPLTGYRIIEIAGIGPGPFAAMMLADMGAEVLRVDRAQSVRGPAPDTPATDVSLRGRRNVAIDLKHPDGVATLLDLVEQADALIEGFRPGVMERLGIGPDECLARNPKLVFGRMTGWGQDGPVRPGRRPRHQLHLARRRAGPHRPGRRGAGPAAQPRRRLRRRRHVPRLRRRVRAARGPAQRPGPGRRRGDGRRHGDADDDVLVDVADRRVRRGRTAAPTCSTPAPTSTTCTAAPTASTSRSARSSRSSTPSCCASPGLDGRRGVRRADGQAAAGRRSRTACAEVFAGKTRAEWCALMEHTDVCFAPVLTMSEAAEHPHNVARSTIVERRRRQAAGAGAPLQPHDARDRPPARRTPASTPARCSRTGASPRTASTRSSRTAPSSPADVASPTVRRSDHDRGRS